MFIIVTERQHTVIGGFKKLGQPVIFLFLKIQIVMWNGYNKSLVTVSNIHKTTPTHQLNLLYGSINHHMAKTQHLIHKDFIWKYFSHLHTWKPSPSSLVSHSIYIIGSSNCRRNRTVAKLSPKCFKNNPFYFEKGVERVKFVWRMKTHSLMTNPSRQNPLSTRGSL